jgi:8-oxo-dGTP pyrophosphatase MutT (NUDIX family)
MNTAGGIVINKGNQVLLIFRKGKWDLPKGKSENGESLKKTAKREVVEETGIDPSSILAITSTLLIVVPDPTPPNVNPLISLPAPISVPP